MCSYEYYITPKEYEIAKNNGISKEKLRTKDKILWVE